MDRAERGMMAWSLAGHDRVKMDVIVGVEQEYALLSDGDLRPLDKPKRKNWKHLQVKKQIPQELQKLNWDQIKNEEIKRSIKLAEKALNRR